MDPCRLIPGLSTFDKLVFQEDLQGAGWQWLVMTPSATRTRMSALVFSAGRMPASGSNHKAISVHLKYHLGKINSD